MSSGKAVGLKPPSKVPKFGYTANRTSVDTVGARTSAVNESVRRVARSQKPTVASAKPTGVKRPIGTALSASDGSKADSSNEKENCGLRTPKRKKRAAWDTKGRLEDMEELTTYLRDKLGSNAEQMNDLIQTLSHNQKELSTTTETNRTLELTIKEKSLQVQQLQASLRQAEQLLETNKRQSDMELQLLRAETERERSLARQEIDQISKRLQEETESLKSLQEAKVSEMTCKYDAQVDTLSRKLKTANLELQCKEEQVVTLNGVIQKMTASQLGTQSELEQMNRILDAKTRLLSERESVLADLRAELSLERAKVESMDERLKEGEKQRRLLHNTIQELKGNIRVFCRVRPILPTDPSDSSDKPGHLNLDCASEGNILLRQIVESGTGKGSTTKEYPFHFDRVFPPGSLQEDVFADISQLVQSALDGYNVCVFAYGQTGSGKTFTMEGAERTLPNELNSKSGMIPRAVSQVFDTAAGSKRGWEYEFSAQMLEIYNETLQDLLATDDTPRKLEIRHLGADKTVVTDLSVIPVKSPEQVYRLLGRAQQNRSQAATLCNERSSRSHSVFTLHITGRNSATGEVLSGDLNLIDLAGSERLNSSGSVGDRLKETQAINKSLTCLGDTIYALGSKGGHVPYRNSKLTFLLQNSLGGNSKTLMFVNVSPVAANFNETLNSLRFAAKVNSCQIGTATRRVAF